MTKLVVLDGYAANPGDLSWDALAEVTDLTVYDRSEPERVIERIGDAPMILVNKVDVGARLMDACPNLKYIGILATGYNIIDTDAARERGIVVSNIPAYSTPSVAQFVFSLILELASQVGSHAESVRRGDWVRAKDFTYWQRPLTELEGKTLCVFGFGQIGRKVAKIALAFGMNVLAVARDPSNAPGIEGVTLVSRQEGFSRADIISLNVPLNDRTKQIVRAETIEGMKPGVWIINTARGALINAAELVEALKAGKIGAYAADVTDVEPMRPDDPLIGAPNCIITPHIAWAPRESRQRLMDIAVENVKAFIAGAPINVVS